ncbi:MAG TPA: PrsW family glutamic-type intramembrane protease [Spirochaetota bacterium]|nr:PrsW family glutamic-type intramembrane protease [Spirochaetota bacterium]HPJ33207.1 PrsW family glutamic-type intramembrane protease [Spirochaetota bacterium]
MTSVYISVGFSTAIWLYLIYRNDRFEPEPVRCLLFVGIAGGLMSALPASFLNTLVAMGLGISRDVLTGESSASLLSFAFFSLFVGFNEEFFKASVSIIILKRLKQFNEPVDGLIYSMTIALGFAAFENIEYTVAGGIGVLIVRSFTAVPLHIGLASIWGSGIARAKFHRGGGYIKNVFPYVVPAALLHAVYNFYQFMNPGDPSSLMFAVVFSFFIIIYASGRLRIFLRESPFRKPGVCPVCGTDNGFWARYCKNCGSYLVSDYFYKCRSCGTRNRAGAKFCRNCGEECKICNGEME